MLTLILIPAELKTRGGNVLFSQTAWEIRDALGLAHETVTVGMKAVPKSKFPTWPG